MQNFSFKTHLIAFLLGCLAMSGGLALVQHERDSVSVGIYDTEVAGAHVRLTEFGDGPRVLEFWRGDVSKKTIVADYDNDGYWDEVSADDARTTFTNHDLSGLRYRAQEFKRFDQYAKMVRQKQFRRA